MLKQLQAGTGMVFGIFVALHLVNTWLAAFGAQTYDGVQSVLRSVYQFAPVEALLLAAMVVHIVVGIMRIVQEPKRHLTMRAKLHRYAGFFLLLVITGHIAAVRGPSWFFDIYPEFAGLAFSINAVPGYFYPYYFLLGLTGFYHALNGSSIAIGRLGGTMRLQTKQLRWASGGASLLLIAALLGLGGVWFDVGDTSESAFAQLALELLGEFTR
jgi:succinate dehydrogenase/fumarate reductase cytochrome b subunit